MKEISDKELIVEFLTRAGFVEDGHNQYVKASIGRIFTRDCDCTALAHKLAKLGGMHQSKKMRDALMIDEGFDFRPVS